MNLKQQILLVICLLLTLTIHGQTLLVRSVIHDATDISASTERRIDNSGEPCALIKLQMVDQLVAIEEAEMVGDAPRFGTTTWLYVPHNTESVTLLFENHDPVSLRFSDHKIPSLQRLCTYVVTLIDQTGVSDPDNPTDAVAQYELALDYMQGRNGRIIDPYATKTWLEKAAAQGHDMAQTYLGTYSLKMSNDKDIIISQKMRQAYFDEGIAWLEKAANAGNTTAMFNLAETYVHFATEDNYKEFNNKGLAWALKAAERGHTRSMEMAGDLLAPPDWLDHGITPDVEQAVSWYKKASSKGSSHASYQLGRLYQSGMYGLKKDKKQARHWYNISSDQGEKKARQRLDDPDLQ